MTDEHYAPIAAILEKISAFPDRYDIDKIKAAFDLAVRAHEGQFRQSGEPYIVHPVAVATSVAELGLDTDSICAAFLHDTLEDCRDAVTPEYLKENFGEDVLTIVSGVTKILEFSIEDREEQQIENLRKMMLATSRDIRVIVVKLCDRLHNMRTLGGKKNEDRQRAIALETMYVYAPLAHRLGMQRIKLELENLALLYLDPIGYKEVTDAVDNRFGKARDTLEHAKERIEARLKETGIGYTLEDRIKSVYSLYRKIYELGKPFEEIYDFYALRIIVGSVEECYAVFGMVHEMFTSVPGRFKDYISMPKPNGYRSLHTTVMSRDGIPFEVQIRTEEMHRTAEFGIAAHWRYKSGEKADPTTDEQLAWIAKLIETDESIRDPDEYIHSFKKNIFSEQLLVFTPKGDVISLPAGATIIDFAYAIHTAVGNRMIGAKINGVIAPIERVPKTGDVVEILTQSNHGPSRDWLSIATTSEARNKIRQWFKKERRTENIAVGKEAVEKEIAHLGRALTASETAELVQTVSARVGMQNVEDLYNTIGFGGISMSRISVKLRDECARMLKNQQAVNRKEADEAAFAGVPETSVERRGKKKNDGGIIVDGLSGCQVKFAKCCTPLPGDPVIGFVTRGYGVSIHKRDCPNAIAGVSSDQKDRWVVAHWENEKGTGSVFEAALRIVTEDKIGVLADISAALADMRVSVLSANIMTAKDGKGLIILTVECHDTGHYEQIVTRLRAIPTVQNVQRSV